MMPPYQEPPESSLSLGMVPVDDDVMSEILGSQDEPDNDGEVDYKDEYLEKLGAYIAREFLEGESLRDERAAEWKRNREDYANVPIKFVSSIIEEAKDIPINHASTKADSLRDLVTGTLFATRPWLTCTARGVASSDAAILEGLMHRVLVDANLEERCKESSEDAWCTNHAILRCWYNPETSEYVIDTIDPECFVVAGGDMFGIENSILVGHSYDERVADITYAIEEKVYRPYPTIITVSEKMERDPTDAVRLAQVFVKIDSDKFKKSGTICPVKDWHIATVDLDMRHILKIQKYTISDRPWYFSASYLPSKKNGGFWSKHSLGSFMQGPHLAYNMIANIAIYGSVGRAFPPVVVEGEMTDQTSQLKWGQAKTSYGGKVTAPFQQFDPSNLEPVMARMERIGDGVARISQAAAGQTFNKGMTATEAQIIAESQSSGVSGYVSTFAITIEEMAEYIYGTFRYTAPGLLEKYGFKSPESMSLFDTDAVWMSTGRGQFASPALRLAQYDKINEMSRDPRLVGKFDPVEIADSQMNLINVPNKERIFDRDRPAPPPIPTPPIGPIGPGAEGNPMQGPPIPGGPTGYPPGPGAM